MRESVVIDGVRLTCEQVKRAYEALSGPKFPPGTRVRWSGDDHEHIVIEQELAESVYKLRGNFSNKPGDGNVAVVDLKDGWAYIIDEDELTRI